MRKSNKTNSRIILDKVLAWKRRPVVDKDGVVQEDMHAATTVAGRCVLIEELLVYFALKQGDHVTADGKLAGICKRELSQKEALVMLESALQKRTMRRELLRLIEESQKP